MDEEDVRFGWFIVCLIGFIFFVCVYEKPKEKEIKLSYEVYHHETDKKYYVIEIHASDGEESASIRWYGYEGKWIREDTHHREGKVFGRSKQLDAELRRAIADGRVKEKETVKKKVVDFLLNDRNRK